ncbi:DgyrCDS8092 [Dimorphilus gyrociliatus]|uniref:DgyrCDS8092 n=1 Tax=Dimorphilus gyrociliatus TaxID=2664684 RepID=A0A7I8VVK9_9ANNE|nr:DgyrCDS8092 [Dimorphilus gyrociliatus]
MSNRSRAKFFVFEFCKRTEISERTANTLFEEEFNTKESLLALTPDVLELIKIPLGQKCLLRKALIELHKSETEKDRASTLTLPEIPRDRRGSDTSVVYRKHSPFPTLEEQVVTLNRRFDTLYETQENEATREMKRRLHKKKKPKDLPKLTLAERIKNNRKENSANYYAMESLDEESNEAPPLEVWPRYSSEDQENMTPVYKEQRETDQSPKEVEAYIESLEKLLDNQLDSLIIDKENNGKKKNSLTGIKSNDKLNSIVDKLNNSQSISDEDLLILEREISNDCMKKKLSSMRRQSVIGSDDLNKILDGNFDKELDEYLKNKFVNK